MLARNDTTHTEKTYHSSDNQPDDSDTTPECLDSLISPVHSSIGNLTLFYFSSFGFNVYTMHCVNVDMRMHAQILKKKKKRQKEAHAFSPPEMPLVISCTFLGNGITTSVPTSVRFTQTRGPNERVATALY